MKIVFLSDDFPPRSFGGAGISTFELAVGFQRSGHEVIVITTCRSAIDAGEAGYQGLRVFAIHSDYYSRWRFYLSLYNPAVVRQVAQLLRQLKPDVVHANNLHFYLSYHCLKLAKRYAKVVIFTARDVMTFNFGKLQTKRYLEKFDVRTAWQDHWRQAGKRWNPLRNFFIRRYLASVDKIFAVSQALAAALEQNGLGRAEVIHTGLDHRFWTAKKDDVDEFRGRYGLRGRKVIFFGGRLSASKGGRQALQVLALAAAKIPDLCLFVAGQLDAFGESLKRQAEKLGLADQLIFTGWVEREELKVALAVSDLVLVPSICFDAFPRIVLEGMVMGKPVVGTCYGGTPEIIVDGVTGYVVNPLNVKDVAEKVIDLLQNPQKAEQFGQAGCERIKTDFNLVDKVAELTREFKSIR